MRKAIAIDFDGCLCTNAYPEIGEPNWPLIRRALTEQKAGAGLILWTCREGNLLQEAVTACEGWGLAFDAVNESLPDWIEEFGTRPRKVGASEYWDDKAARIPTAQRFFVGGAGDDSIELFEPAPGNENMKLKPCPFCGGTSIFYERYGSPAGERWRCWCAECLAGIDPGTAQETGQVREMWNKRAVPSNLPLTLDQLREMDGEPVCIAPVDGGPYTWMLVDTKYEVCREAHGGLAVFENLGKTWVAYRHKPENGA